MVYIHNCWVFGLCPSSNILKNEKAKNTTFRKLDLLPSSGEAKEGEGGVKQPTQIQLPKRRVFSFFVF
jgi:hypothetical protein